MVIILSLCVVQGVDLVYSVPGLVVIIDKLARYLYDMNIAESEVQPQGEYNTVLYCTVLQVQPQGEYNLAGVNLGGMRDTMALQNVFFRNPSFGVRRSNNQMFREVLTTTAAKIFVTHYLKIFSQSWAATTASGQSTSATGSSSSAAGRRAPASPPTPTTTSSTAWTPTWSASSKTDGRSVPGK